MKHITIIRVLLILLILSAISCNDNVTPALDSAIASNETRDINEAIYIAESAAHIFSNRARSEEIKIREVKTITTTGSRSCNYCDTLIYIIDYENIDGYALVSASNYGEALLAYIENGSSDDVLAPEFNPVLSLAENYVQTASNSTLVPSDLTRHKVETEWITTNQIGPKIEVRFGPDRWEADFCPNGDAGAEIIALAQMLSFYESPNELSNGLPFDWSLIKQHDIAKHDHSYSTGNNDNFMEIPEECPLQDSDHLKFSQFIRDLGSLCNADYSSSKTKINDPILIVDVLNQYVGNINWSFSPITEDKVLDQTIQNGIGILFGLDASDQIVLVWVADGYKDVDIYTNEYINKTSSPYFGWELIDSRKTGEARYYHYNWGWYGKCNGYFNVKVFDPLNASEYDYNKNNNTDKPYLGLTKQAAIISINHNEN